MHIAFYAYTFLSCVNETDRHGNKRSPMKVYAFPCSENKRIQWNIYIGFILLLTYKKIIMKKFQFRLTCSLEGVLFTKIVIMLNNNVKGRSKARINVTTLIFWTPVSLKVCKSAYCLNNFNYFSVICEYYITYTKTK